MQTFSSSIDVRSTPEALWRILTDAASYANWNPEIRRVEGCIAAGQTLRAHVALHGGKLQPVGVRVTRFDAPRSMEWTGGLPLGLFTGRRRFTLEPKGSGVVGFTIAVQFSGPFSGPIARSLGDRQPDLDAFAAGLKRWAER